MLEALLANVSRKSWFATGHVQRRVFVYQITACVDAHVSNDQCRSWLKSKQTKMSKKRLQLLRGWRGLQWQEPLQLLREMSARTSQREARSPINWRTPACASGLEDLSGKSSGIEGSVGFSFFLSDRRGCQVNVDMFFESGTLPRGLR